MWIQNMTGHFLLLGVTNIPFIYHVYTLRDGGRVTQRRVDVTQDAENGIVFTAVISFKRAEENAVERSARGNLEERFAKALKSKQIEDHATAPGIDSPL
jgi:acyl-CoA thioesterase